MIGWWIDRPMALAIAVAVLIVVMSAIGVMLSGVWNCC